ncbi:MAG TPA: archaetidylserine decarboxylase [Steroidobacteraceae bacterium]|nr:archaetidylserine decarboxylase [Steroidobacteraceae bacterium]
MGSALRDRAFIGLQHLLPQHLLTRLLRVIARSRIGLLRTALIRGFLQSYPVDLSEAILADPAQYRSFNDFFTRRLRAGARPADPDPRAVLCPVDGQLSQAGAIEGDTLLQAKGIRYTAAALLGGDAALAAPFAGGAFATLYLAPHNYHRVHMPLAGTLVRARFVPGDLYSVNAATAAGVPGLFTRNERVACVFDTAAGPMAVVLVGALFVGSMSLAWCGEIRAPGGSVRELPVHDPIIALERGAELGCFNMGSTVVLMFAPGGPTLVDGLSPGRAVKFGERIATLP